jgi:hypothetical protein
MWLKNVLIYIDRINNIILRLLGNTKYSNFKDFYGSLRCEKTIHFLETDKLINLWQN